MSDPRWQEAARQKYLEALKIRGVIKNVRCSQCRKAVCLVSLPEDNSDATCEECDSEIQLTLEVNDEAHD